MADFVKIELALNLLLTRDGYLLEKDINERSITHKLAEYLQGLFLDWNVDCEFNKNLDLPKNIEIKPQDLLMQMANYLRNKFLYTENNMQDILTGEEVERLIEQLQDPEIEYVEDLDLYLFLLKIGRRTIKKTIFPDIIVHHRGTLENNIVIEAKKTSNNNKEGRFYDLIKIATLVSSPQFNYKKGIFIDLPTGDDFYKFNTFQISRASFKNVFKYLPQKHTY